MVFLGGHPAKYWPPTDVCAVCECVCVCVLLCLVFIIAVRLGDMVIFYQLSTLTLQVTVNSAMSQDTILKPFVQEIRNFFIKAVSQLS